MERNLYKKLDELILTEKTGPIETLAEKMKLTPRQAKYKLEVLKNTYDCPIKYVPSKRSYCYTKPGHCILGFHQSKSDEMLKEIKALKRILEMFEQKG